MVLNVESTPKVNFATKNEGGTVEIELLEIKHKKKEKRNLHRDLVGEEEEMLLNVESTPKGYFARKTEESTVEKEL
jgi:hypothetical protein